MAGEDGIASVGVGRRIKPPQTSSIVFGTGCEPVARPIDIDANDDV